MIALSRLLCPLRPALLAAAVACAAAGAGAAQDLMGDMDFTRPLPQSALEVAELRGEIAQARRDGEGRRELGLLSDLFARAYANPGEIARYAELARQFSSDNPDRDNRLAFLASEVGYLDLAAALYEQVAASRWYHGRLQANLLTNLATVYSEQGRLEDALDAAERATAADETYAQAWAVRGLLLDAVGRSAEALPILEHALELGARNPALSEAIIAARQGG